MFPWTQQEESRSISENVTWGQRKRFADGKVSLPYGQFLGYTKGEDGLPKIVESEAKTVRLIYKLFLEGKYYVEKSHPAIIKSEVFDMVQHEMKLKRRKEKGGHHSGESCFSSKIICGECGHFFGSKVWHSTSKYRRTIWQCNHKFKGAGKCQTLHLNEAALKQLFLNAFNQLVINKDEVMDNCEIIKQVLTDTSALDTEAEKQKSEIAAVTELTRQWAEENARVKLDQAEYQQRYASFEARYEKAKVRLEKIEELQQARRIKREQLDTFLSTLLRQDTVLTEFDEDLWIAVIDKVTVFAEDDVRFIFRDGTVIKV